MTPTPADPLADHSISMGQLVSIMRRRWWIVALLPVTALVATIFFQRHEPYQSRVRATVLLPGDTEIPGNSERPEMMVMDDLPPFVRSYVFAEGVHSSLQSGGLSVQDVKDALDAERYSRILTILVTGENPDDISAIAAAAATSLDPLVNDYLVSGTGSPATVKIIDPPTAPSRSRDGHLLQLLITTGLGVLIGALIAIAIGARDGGRLAPEGRPALQPGSTSALSK